MISTSDIKNGLNIIIKEQPWVVVDFLHVKPGKGQAFVRTTLRNLKDGKVVEHTFKAGEKFEEANVTYKRLQYLYNDTDNFYFMDPDYEQIFLDSNTIGNMRNFLIDSAWVDGIYIDGSLIGINMPPKMEFTVIQAPPGIKGDSATGARKTVKIETEFEVKTPLFINEGDKIVVNTETGEYVGRA